MARPVAIAYTLHMAQRRTTGSGRQTSNRKQDAPPPRGLVTQRGGRAGKVHSSPNFVQAEIANPGPWIDVSSSRMRAIRYDYGLRAIFVEFRDGTYWVYESVQYAVFYNFQRAASKGKFIDRTLNSYPYREALQEEALRPTTHAGAPGR